VHGALGYGHELVEAIRAKVPVVPGTSTLGAPLAMDVSVTDGPPASHNENYIILDYKTPWRLIMSYWIRSLALLCRTSEEHVRFFA
jgi:hypothetical protein